MLNITNWCKLQVLHLLNPVSEYPQEYQDMFLFMGSTEIAAHKMCKDFIYKQNLQICKHFIYLKGSFICKFKGSFIVRIQTEL